MDINIILNNLPNPAKRAFKNAGIETIDDLLNYSETQILELHGIGKKGVATLKENLAKFNLSLKDI